MNRSKALLLRKVALLALAATIVGCRHEGRDKGKVGGSPAWAGNVRLFVVDTELNSSVERVVAGDKLQWEQPTGSPKKKFYVHFIGDSPCVPAQNPVIGENGVASCMVGASRGGPNYYEYYIDISPTASATGPRSCRGCLIIQTGPLQGSTAGPQGPATPSGTAINSGSDPYPFIYCESGQVDVMNGTDPGAVIKWLGNPSAQNWSVSVVSPQPSLCAEPGPFTQSSRVCHLTKPRTQDFVYTVTTSNCGSKKITIPKP